MFARNSANANTKCSFGTQLVIMFPEEDEEVGDDEEEEGGHENDCGDCGSCSWCFF